MTAKRNSSFELLRIILIFMILIEHGNMWFIGSGYESEMEHSAKCIIESVCIGAVNAFVLISGWFGIKKGMGKIGYLIFTLLFCTLPILAIALISGILPVNIIFSPNGFYEYVLGGIGYWFVVAYIGLLVLSEPLNIGIERISQRQFRNILIVGYVLIFIYDFCLHTSEFGIEGGYSVGWFVYLYLLAAYMRKYGIRIFDKYRWPILVSVITIQSFLFFKGYIGLRYTNPLILSEAICFLYIFNRHEFYNKYINYLAGSCLIAYLLHMQPVFGVYLRRFLMGEYVFLGYWKYMAEMFGLCIVCFLIAVVINRLLGITYSKLFLR